MDTQDYEHFEDEVGRLIFCCKERPTVTPFRAILRNDQFDLGRKDFEQVYGINETTISTHHVRFRSIMYDAGPDAEEKIIPMVYVCVLSANPVRVMHAAAGLENEECTICNGDADFLLTDGDILQLTPKMSLLFSAEESYLWDSKGIGSICRAETAQFDDHFQVTDRKLGFGGQASVFVAVKQPVGQQVACKITPRPTTTVFEYIRSQRRPRTSQSKRDARLKEIEQDLIRCQDRLVREFTILKDLQHPNIISLEKVICATYNVYIFQELITGGDLMSFLDQKGALGEAQSAVITRQLLKAVQYLHQNQIVHRDIKPENILMTSSREGCRIVLTDFGYARTNDDTKAARNEVVARMKTQVGTHGYTAPEVLQQVRHDIQQKGYSKAIDIWSVGCVTATLLTNTSLFPAPVPLEQSWDISIIDHGLSWAKVGRKAKSFIKGCLILDESERLTANQALLDPWFTNKYYAKQMDDACERAIQDWKPRPTFDNFVEYIDTTDSVPLKSRLKHVERLVGEVKSRYFEDMPSTAPTLPTLPPYSEMSQPSRLRTPIPGIGEDISSDGVEVPDSPSVTQLHDLFVTQIADPDYTRFANTHETAGDFSIHDFAPPATQFSPPVITKSPLDFADSPTQSQ